jgi:nicotinate-nucleotide adenylyltransferase
VLGGTFDPVHLGHLVMAAEACAALRLDELLLVPAGEPPHKPAVPITPAAHRVAMLELAAAHEPLWRVSLVDVERPGPHYTVDMLGAVAALRPGAQLFAVIGGDSLRDLLSWRDPAGVVAAAALAVASRPDAVPDLEALERRVPGIAERTVFLDSPAIGISATDIRRRVAESRPIRHQVPAAVEAYIRRHGIYLDDAV